MQVHGITVAVSEASPTANVVDMIAMQMGDSLIDTIAPVISLYGTEFMTVVLPMKVSVYQEPGWSAVDAIDGDITMRVRAKLLNSSAPTTTAGVLNFAATEPTPTGMPYVIR
jgi:hypothetical protein